MRRILKEVAPISSDPILNDILQPLFKNQSAISSLKHAYSSHNLQQHCQKNLIS